MDDRQTCFRVESPISEGGDRLTVLGGRQVATEISVHAVRIRALVGHLPSKVAAIGEGCREKLGKRSIRVGFAKEVGRRRTGRRAAPRPGSNLQRSSGGASDMDSSVSKTG
jgi:hypothetical protein